MSRRVLIELEMPDDLDSFNLPQGLHRRLQDLLDRQDSGVSLTPEEREEAQGIADLSEMLSLLKMRARRLHAETPESNGSHSSGTAALGEKAGVGTL